jgi:hypothetical protein
MYSRWAAAAGLLLSALSEATMQSENAFKLGSILLLVGFCVAGANVNGSGLSAETIRSESARVEVAADSPALELYQESEIRKELEVVQEINKMNVSEFAPYKIK